MIANPKNRKRILGSACLAFGAILLGAFVHREFTSRREGLVASRKPGMVDDMSHMNATNVQQVWDISGNESAAETDLRNLLEQARTNHLHVAIAGAGHSMGGQTIVPNGIRINMLPLKAMALDEQTDVLHVDAGALWADVVPYLDHLGRSVAVMQSNNNFTVGGSLSVNCHGWQYGRPPIASTVESIHLMTADGKVLRCSRKENKELFSLALGGYGLFGIILDADLHVVKNERLRMEQKVVPLNNALALYDQMLHSRGAPHMLYARLNISPRHMFNDILITAFYPANGEIPKLTSPKLLGVGRVLFNESRGSEFGKEIRWEAETKIAPHLAGTTFSRNQLMNQSSDWFSDHSNATTDILHEYFLPRDGAPQFLKAAKSIIRAHSDEDLLNVTVREIQTDDDTFLRYADQPMLAFVMYFSQKRTTAADSDMERMTQELIDAALRSGGRYYLPYRLHASTAEFRSAYPQAGEFFRLKKIYDPDELLENEFYEKYAKP